jgi:hypothetical protein
MRYNIPINPLRLYLQTKQTTMKNNSQTANEIKTLFEVICLKSNSNGLTKGNTYSVVAVEGIYYKVKPDDYGSLSGWDKRYFELMPEKNPSLDALLSQLDIWIKECESEANYFRSRGMLFSEESSISKKDAYLDVKAFLQENTLT